MNLSLKVAQYIFSFYGAYVPFDLNFIFSMICTADNLDSNCVIESSRFISFYIKLENILISNHCTRILNR